MRVLPALSTFSRLNKDVNLGNLSAIGDEQRWLLICVAPKFTVVRKSIGSFRILTLLNHRCGLKSRFFVENPLFQLKNAAPTYLA